MAPNLSDLAALKNEFKRTHLSPGSEMRRLVMGVGIGPKNVSGVDVPVPSIRVYVDRKMDDDELGWKFRIPKSFDTVPTDVLATGRFRPLPGGPPPRSDAMQAAPGCSIAVRTSASNVPTFTRCTFGAIVSDGKARYLLGPNHVFSLNGRMRDNAEVILVTAPDSGQAALAHPTERFEPLYDGGPNTMDCALAAIVDGAPISPAVPQPMGPLHLAVPIDSTPNMKVVMAGAATQNSYGRIVDVLFDFTTDYSFGTFQFEDQVLITVDRAQGNKPATPEGFLPHGIATHGDSGALLIDETSRQATAMVFAGARDFTVACPLQRMLEKFEMQLLMADEPVQSRAQVTTQQST